MPTFARGCIAAAQPVNTVLLNGKVPTGGRDFSAREALAIRGSCLVHATSPFAGLASRLGPA
ncbi:hypothetical protein [Muricoccus aerilatus]|uniref:hypothetical protein n=1 Tax=Muricoccus aerilatus TaxID=452982 RepID=UPI0005C17082|nr:hypothetical protein [Roseomonas aerilata]